MTSDRSLAFRGLKIFLIGFIIFSLSYSLFLDQRQLRLGWDNDLRKQLPFKDLLAMEEGRPSSGPDLNKYLRYFQSLTQGHDSQPDSHAMIGFCYYHLGQADKALTAYQKAVSLKPDFLFFQYDLGVIYLEQGQYRQALESFKKALETRPQDNVRYLRGSKIFVYMIYRAGSLEPSLGERLKRGYGLSAYLASLCFDKLGDAPNALLFRQEAITMGVDDQPRVIKPGLYIF